MRQHCSRRSVRNLCRFAIIAMIILLSMPMAIYPQGFGIIKKDVHFSRLRPPKLFVHTFDVAVRVDSLRNISEWDFKRSLERELASGEPRINLNSPQPQIIIVCQLNSLSETETWTKKSEYERQKVGEEEVWNEKKQKMEKKDVYKSVKVEKRYRTVTWSTSIDFRIAEAKSATMLASDNKIYSESKEFKEGQSVSKPLNLQGWLNLTAKEIAAYLVPTREEVRILLPKGKLDDISDKIEERKLAEALQELEAMPSLKKPEDEAYKFYILGACYEAMAYENDKTDLLNHYLEQGAKNYAKALDIKPDEKRFREAQNRLQTSVAIYKELNERYYAVQKTSKPKESLATPSSNPFSKTGFKPAAHASPPPSPKTEPKTATEMKTSTPSKSQPETKTTDALTNETIVRLVKARLSEENIIATINEAPAVSFDLSSNAQVQLLQAGVTNPVISAMRQAANHKKEGDAPATPAAATVNVSGVWYVTVKMPSGTINSILVLKQEGEKLTGTYKASERDLPLIGIIGGNDIIFSYYANHPKQEFEVKFAGKLEGKDSLKGKATLGKLGEAPWMAKKQ